MAILSALALASSMSLAGVDYPVYLATFANKELENKTRISFHHALLIDNNVSANSEGVLLQLSKKEVSLLKAKGIKLSPADELWQEHLNNNFKQKILQNYNTNETGGIPGYACYETVEETLSTAQLLSEQYPGLTSWIDIGDSWQKQNGNAGYDLKVLKIGNKDLVDPPILFIQSAMHAKEYATAALTLAFAKKLLQGAGNDADIDWILNRHQIHILFQTNPDGRKIAEQGNLQRKNQNENHCPAGNVGVDLNRNFSFGWGEVPGGSSGDDCSDIYRGSAPGSEPEVAALETYIRSIYPDARGDDDNDAAPVDTQGLYLDIHSYSELILWPFGHTDLVSPNNKGLKALGRKLAYFNGYTPMQSVGLYPTDGTSDNLAYGELGVAHITFELGTAFFQSCSAYEGTIKPDNLDALMYAAKVVEAPYLLTSGPDVVDLHVTTGANNELLIEGVATDLRFRNENGTEPTQNIKQVRYSLNEYPTDQNTQLATIKDGAADAKSEEIVIDISGTETSVVYVQASDESEQFGPVSAIKVSNNMPDTEAVISCNGAKCRFEGSDINSAYSYQWQLADGRTSEEVSAEFIMPAIGDYTAVYTVENKPFNLSGTVVINFSVTELLAPEVDFSVNCTEKTCQFDASSTTDFDSTSLEYQWNFGNGATGTGITASHIYESIGSYEVKLTVTDEHEQSSIVTKTAQTQEPVKNDSSGGSLAWLLLFLFGVRRFK